MPVPFGFSVGDFISVCILIKDVVQALDSSRGSSAEYQELIRELWALDRALLEVVNLAQNFETTVELNALSHTARRTADQCLNCIKNFLVKIQTYEKPLSEGGSGNLLRDVKGKVTWALLKRDDLQKFRTEINAHSSAINMLLITASVSLTRISHAKIQERFEDAQQASESSSTQQLTLIGQVQDALGEQSKNLEAHGSTISRLAEGVNYFFTLGAELRSLMSNILTFNIRFYDVLLDLQNRVPPEVQPNWQQEPLTLTDALGRVAPLHLELINTWEVLESVLEARFRNIPGEQKIRQKQYALRDRTSQRDVTRDVQFETCFLPGRRIDMCAVFEGGPTSQTSCPNCHWELCQEAAGGSTCEKCGMWFQRVEELENTPADIDPETQTNTPQEESISVFKRVRLLSRNIVDMVNSQGRMDYPPNRLDDGNSGKTLAHSEEGFRPNVITKPTKYEVAPDKKRKRNGPKTLNVEQPTNYKQMRDSYYGSSSNDTREHRHRVADDVQKYISSSSKSSGKVEVINARGVMYDSTATRYSGASSSSYKSSTSSRSSKVEVIHSYRVEYDSSAPKSSEASLSSYKDNKKNHKIRRRH